MEDFGVAIAEVARQLGISTSGVSKILTRSLSSLSTTSSFPGYSVKSPRVSGQQRLHHPRRRSSLHFQEQMEMVRHQNVGVEVKRITLSRRGQTVDKRFVVAVVKKYLPTVVAAGHHVIEQSLRMDSGMSGHDARLSKLVDLGKSDTGMTPEWN